MALKWNVNIVNNLLERKKEGSFTLASGFSPSGWIHVGTFREAAVTDMIGHCLGFAGKDYSFKMFVDDLDPLTKIPTGWNLPQEAIGKPLCFLAKLYPAFKPTWTELSSEIDLLQELFPKMEVIFMSKEYLKGTMNKHISLVIKNRKKIDDFIKSELNEETNWLPVLGLKSDYSYASKGRYKRGLLIQDEESINILNGGGKLAWKLDWPARWNLWEVDFEPCGKDVGSSLNAANWVSENIYQNKVPLNFIYEYVLNSKGEKISKSKGGEIRLKELTNLTPSWNIKHWLLKRPASTITLNFEKLVRNIDLIIEETLAYQSLPEDRKPFSLIHYIFTGEIPSFPSNTNLIQILRILSWSRIDEEEHISAQNLINRVSPWFKGWDFNNKRVVELVFFSYQYWLKVSNLFLRVKDISPREIKILVRVIDFIKLNVGDDFLVRNFTSSKETREILYLVLNFSKEGGSPFLTLLQNLGRSKIISLLEKAIISRTAKHFAWEELKRKLEQ